MHVLFNLHNTRDTERGRPRELICIKTGQYNELGAAAAPHLYELAHATRHCAIKLIF